MRARSDVGYGHVRSAICRTRPAGRSRFSVTPADSSLPAIRRSAGLSGSIGQARPTPALPEARGFEHVRLSPDGRQAALTIHDVRKRDLWILDLAGGTLTPLTNVGTVRNPAWSADSRRVLYPSTQDGPAALWWQPADASGPPSRRSIRRTIRGSLISRLTANTSRTLRSTTARSISRRWRSTDRRA